MGPLIAIEDRLQVEVERRWLSSPHDIPAEALTDIADMPSLLTTQRWGMSRASDLVRLLQPWTERPATEGDRITKVAGARYVTLVGLVDEPWVRVLVDDGHGRLTPWRERDRGGADATLTVVGVEHDLVQLLAPRTSGPIEAMLRRSSGIAPEVDWMLESIFGLSVPGASGWMATSIASNESAGLALVRRDMVAARRLLIDGADAPVPLDKRMLRDLRNLREIERVVELMRSRAAASCGSDRLVAVLSEQINTVCALARGDAAGSAIADAWMHGGALDAWRRRGDLAVADTYPLCAYQGGDARRGDIAAAMCDPATFTFHVGAMSSADLLSGTTRTLFPVSGDQPVDTLFGVELMRLAVLGLRGIARKSGHGSALSHRNRDLTGRLALWLTRLIAPAHFYAYADRWANMVAVRAAGLTARHLDQGLADPDFTHDIGGSMVFKNEQVRRFVPVAEDSVFDPWLWNRPSSTETWAAGYTVAAGGSCAQDADSLAKRDLLATVAAWGTDMPRVFAARGDLVAEATRIAAAIGPHETPLGTDPALLTLSMAASSRALGAGGAPRLLFIKHGRRKLRELAARGRRMARSEHRVRSAPGADQSHDNGT